jgi:hypothetical protein
MRPIRGLLIKGLFISLACLMMSSLVLAAAADREPSVRHGAGEVVGGLLFELPKTVFEATVSGPPVAGTVVGILAGVIRALQKTASGLAELSVALDVTR